MQNLLSAMLVIVPEDPVMCKTDRSPGLASWNSHLNGSQHLLGGRCEAFQGSSTFLDPWKLSPLQVPRRSMAHCQVLMHSGWYFHGASEVQMRGIRAC